MSGPDPALLARGHVTYRLDGPVATVALARSAARNAQTFDTWAALAHVHAHLPAEVRVLVVCGEGSSFSAGLDRAALVPGPGSQLAALAAATREESDATITGFQRSFGWLSDPQFVSVAAVQGHAVGAGFQLALACDLVVVADDAQFQMAEVSLGLVPDLGGTGRLVRLVGPARALEICATGRRVGAAEAVRIGLALAAVPARDLDDAVADLVAALLEPPVDAVRAVTRLIAGATERTEASQLAMERAEQFDRLRALAARTGV